MSCRRDSRCLGLHALSLHKKVDIRQDLCDLLPAQVGAFVCSAITMLQGVLDHDMLCQVREPEHLPDIPSLHVSAAAAEQTHLSW